MATVTLIQAVDEYLAGRPRGTAARYRVGLRSFLTWCDLNQLHLQDIRRVHIESYRRWLIDHRSLAEHTAATYVGTVCGLFRYATAEGIIPEDPSQHVHRGGRRRASSTPWYNADQLRRLLAAPAHPDVHAAICLLALNGLRLGELLAAQVADIHEIAGHTCLRLPHRKTTPGGQDVALPARTLTALAPLRAARTTGPLIRIPALHKGPAGAHGERSRRDATRFRSALTRTATTAGLPRITPHGLRHTFITLARDAGVPDRDIMAATGHTDPRMLTYYDRAHASVARAAAHTVAAWLDTPPTITP